MSDTVFSRRSTHGLLWKEARLLFPLMIGSIFLSLFVLSIGLLFMDKGFKDVEGVPMSMAVFFAVGAGAILIGQEKEKGTIQWLSSCLLYTSPSPRDQRGSRMPSSA